MTDRTMCVFTLYSYEDTEIKAVVRTLDEAQAWVAENRSDDMEDDIRIEKWAM